MVDDCEYYLSSATGQPMHFPSVPSLIVAETFYRLFSGLPGFLHCQLPSRVGWKEHLRNDQTTHFASIWT